MLKKETHVCSSSFLLGSRFKASNENMIFHATSWLNHLKGATHQGMSSISSHMTHVDSQKIIRAPALFFQSPRGDRARALRAPALFFNPHAGIGHAPSEKRRGPWLLPPWAHARPRETVAPATCWRETRVCSSKVPWSLDGRVHPFPSRSMYEGMVSISFFSGG